MVNKIDLNCNKNNFVIYDKAKSILIIDHCEDFKPLVSIMIPTFKRPHLLKNAIDSALNQITNKSFEVVIIDNDSGGEFSNEIEELINSYHDKKIRYFRNDKNIGMFGNWNRCIEIARSEKLTILNDDDLLHKQWLDVVMDDKYKEYDLVKVDNFRFEKDNDIKNITDVSLCSDKKITMRSCIVGNINPGSLGLLLTKSKCIEIGGFSPDLFPTADYDFILRYVNKYKCISIKKVLSYYRWAENESMKKEVLEGFLINDFNMRKFFFDSNKLNNMFNHMITYKYYLELKKINDDIKVDFLNVDFIGGNYFIREVIFKKAWSTSLNIIKLCYRI